MITRKATRPNASLPCTQIYLLPQVLLTYGLLHLNCCDSCHNWSSCHWTNDMELVPKQFAWAGHANWLFLLYTEVVNVFFFLISTRHIERIGGAFYDDVLYKLTFTFTICAIVPAKFGFDLVWPTLNFLTPKVECFTPLPRWPLVSILGLLTIKDFFDD